MSRYTKGEMRKYETSRYEKMIRDTGRDEKIWEEKIQEDLIIDKKRGKEENIYELRRDKKIQDLR